MSKIIGNTTATPNPRPDWNQTDEKKADYIKNKPNLTDYAKESYVDEKISDAKSDRKLKLLKTITLEEDVASLKVEFDKPLDEIAILYNVAFTAAESGKAFATRTDVGNWYMFYRSGLSLSTNKRLWYAHAKEISERQWETFVSDWFFSLSGIGDSTTTPRIIVSKRIEAISRYIEELTISLPSNTSGNAFAAGSTIQIWGHEVDE